MPREVFLRVLVIAHGLVRDGQLPGADGMLAPQGVAQDEVGVFETEVERDPLVRIGGGGAHFDGLPRLAAPWHEHRDGVSAGFEFFESEAAIGREGRGGKRGGNAEERHGSRPSRCNLARNLVQGIAGKGGQRDRGTQQETSHLPDSIVQRSEAAKPAPRLLRRHGQER